MGRWPTAFIGLLVLVVAPCVPTAAAGTPQRFLVSFDHVTPAVGDLLHGVRVLDSFPFARVALVEGAPSVVRLLPGVVGVFPEEVLTPALDRVRAADHADPARPGDPSWPTGRGVTVAIVDSGIDTAHPGFAGRVAADVRISHAGVVSDGAGDADGHGTHVAGILAGSGAKSENGRLHGLAPGARIVGIDISDSFTTTSAVRAFQWVHDHREELGIRVVTSSWGREKSDAHYDENDPVIRASDALVADGLTVVFSAGNRGRDGSGTLTTEAMDPNVISVGASTLAGRVESYSSKGPAHDAAGAILPWVKPDVVAPGSGVISARTSSKIPGPGLGDEDRYYWAMNGTSMAAPQAAATAALLLEKHPSLTPFTIQAILQASAHDVGAPGPDPDSGYGMLDVGSALAMADALSTGARTVTVESRQPVHAEGQIVGTQGHILLLNNGPRGDAPGEVTHAIDAPAGAALADLAFTWSGPASFDAQLVAPDGATYAFQPTDAPGKLVLQHAIKPGLYTLVAKPTGAANDASYQIDGDIVIRSSRVVGDAPNELTSRASTYATLKGGFDVPEPTLAVALDDLEASPQILLSALVVLSVLAAVVAVRPRRG